jgi:type I restriction enzyme S subunit
VSTVLQQQYADMISSSVEWAEMTPAHWEIQRLGRLFRESSQRASTCTELGYPILSVSIHDGISDKEMNEEELDRKVTRSDDRSLYKVVEENDLAYNMMRAWQGGFGAAQVNGLISPAYVVCKPRTSHPSRFFELLLRTPTAVTELKRFSRGITDFRLRLYWDDFKKIEVAVPPAREQKQILAFLDYETAKIDALIEKQQQLIALLGEKRQAVISHAVTKGLNPDAPMRDSGIEWLGQVPEHWKVKKGGFIGALFSSESVKEDQVVEEGSLPFIKVSSMSNDGFQINSWDWFVAPGSESRYQTRCNYVVFPKRGAAIFLNKVNVVGRASLIDPNLMGWQIGKDSNSYFMAYLLKTRKLDELADVSTVPQINNKHISPEKFPVPPIAEQDAIVEFLDGRMSKLNDLQCKVEDGLELLQERRTALISAAVTGKIDVRGWKPPSSARMPETEMEVA